MFKTGKKLLFCTMTKNVISGKYILLYLLAFTRELVPDTGSALVDLGTDSLHVNYPFGPCDLSHKLKN